MQQHEEEVKKRLYKTLLATVIVVGVIVIGMTFFAPVVGSFFRLISKIGKPVEKEDTLPPPPPYFYGAPRSVNKSTITLSGFSEPGSKVVFFVNGPQAGNTIADVNGTFNIEGIDLIEGKNTIYAKAEDAFQNQSQTSQSLEVMYDTKKPKIELIEPKDGATIRNLNQRVTVKGTVDEKCEVRINEKLAISRPDNSFELLLGVEEGEVKIKIEATDEAGNKEEKEITIKYVKSGI